MKNYIVRTIDKSSNEINEFEEALNNPPDHYEVDGYQAVSGDDETYRYSIVVYKLVDIHTEMPSGRKFK